MNIINDLYDIFRIFHEIFLNRYNIMIFLKDEREFYLFSLFKISSKIAILIIFNSP